MAGVIEQVVRLKDEASKQLDSIADKADDAGTHQIGIGSGLGKTAGRGHKGSFARAGACSRLHLCS